MVATKHKPELIIIAGPNGSGKTSVTQKFVHHEWAEGTIYINPDQIAEDNVWWLERPDGCRRSIEADKMNGDIAVVLKRGGDRQPRGERAAEGVYKHVDRFALVLGEHIVNVGAVEVPATDIAFISDFVSLIRLR